MGKKYNFMEGLKQHWKNKPRCECLNCKKYAKDKAEYIKGL